MDKATDTDEIAQAYAEEARHAVKILAREMRQLADYLLAREAFRHNHSSATSVAADIINDFTQGTGTMGARLWSITHSAGKADAARRQDG